MTDDSDERERRDMEIFLRIGATLARESAQPNNPVRARKELAALLVDYRERLGDYLGLSHQYRRQVSEIYRRAGLSKRDGTRVRNGVRHHISQVLRERLTPEQLAEHGLTVESRNELRNARRSGG